MRLVRSAERKCENTTDSAERKCENTTDVRIEKAPATETLQVLVSVVEKQLCAVLELSLTESI